MLANVCTCFASDEAYTSETTMASTMLLIKPPYLEAALVAKRRARCS